MTTDKQRLAEARRILRDIIPAILASIDGNANAGNQETEKFWRLKFADISAWLAHDDEERNDASNR